MVYLQVQPSPFTESKDNMATTYEKIATTTLGSAQSTIEFSSISSAYTDLRLVLVGTMTTADVVRMRFNSDSGNNYSRTYLYGDGTSAVSGRSTNSSSIGLATNYNWQSATVNMVEIDIFSYAGSTYKTTLHTESFDLNGSGNVVKVVGLWRNTSAINTITFSTGGYQFSSGFTATLYGILKA